MSGRLMIQGGHFELQLSPRCFLPVVVDDVEEEMRVQAVAREALTAESAETEPLMLQSIEPRGFSQRVCILEGAVESSPVESSSEGRMEISDSVTPEIVPTEQILGILQEVLATTGEYCPLGIEQAFKKFEDGLKWGTLLRATSPEEDYPGEVCPDYLHFTPSKKAAPESYPLRQDDSHGQRISLFQARERLVQFVSPQDDEKPYIIRLIMDNLEGQRCTFEIFQLSEEYETYMVVWNNRVFLLQPPNSYYFRHFLFLKSVSSTESLRRDGCIFERVDISPIEEKLPDRYWSHWETMQGAIECYKFTIYPMFCQYVKHLIDKGSDRQVTISDFGCGSGNLALRILGEGGGRISHYYGVEFNQDEVRIAQERLKPLEKGVKIAVFQGDASQVNCDTIPPTVIVICCGLLTCQVLKDRDEALRMLQNIALHVAPGGHVLISGIAQSLIYSQDLEDLGFRVIKRFCPETNHYFYVAKRR